jgi:hypothetical protein
MKSPFVTKSILAAFVVACIGIGTMPSAKAVSVFNWSFNGGADGAGTLTTNGPCGTSCDIVDITGTFHGYQITGLLGAWTLFNDNILYFPAPYLDVQGFAFSVAGAPYTQAAIYLAGTGATYYKSCTNEDLNNPCFGAFDNNATFDLSAAQTPLPATLPLFATGLAALGLTAWRRKRKAEATL